MHRFSTLAVPLVLLIASGPWWAHAHLVRSTPAPNSTVTPPQAITLTFNERLIAAFSKLQLTTAQHGMTLPLKTAVSKDGRSLIGVPQGRLRPGAYGVTWTAASADGHKTKGQLAFRVR